MRHGALERFVGSMTVGELAHRLALPVGELVERAAGRKRPVATLRPPPMDIELSTLTMAAVLTQLQALAGLSGGQLDVAERIIMGETDKDIAERLGCSERTAKRKVAEVVHKCGAPTRSGILAGVLRNGST